MNARLTSLLAAAILGLAALAAYANSFSGVFVLDDFASIGDNPSIRQLWPLSGPLSPPTAAGVGGRPLLNLSYALNYAAGGTAVTGYHAVNLLLHFLAGLALFGLVRRTLRRRTDAWAPSAAGIAGAIALLWIADPVQTASVTYLSQRAESLAGLFYLLTLYGFVRSIGPSRRTAFGWIMLSWLACLCGVLSKEIAVTAPVVVLLYDRTWVAGSFRSAWRQRWTYYVALASTWLWTGYTLLTTHPAERGLGAGTGLSSPAYALTEGQVVIRYLGLALWPHPLVLDYNLPAAANFAAALPWLAAVALLLAATIYALRRRPALGFLGATFFILLAPSSSIVPVSGEVMAENRLYLPLAVVITLAVLAGYRWAGWRSWLLWAPLAVVLGAMTASRNADYRSERGLWALTTTQRPDNPRARYQWANALLREGHAAEAIEQYDRALRLNPQFPEAWDGRGVVLAGAGHFSEAIAAYREAVRLRPSYPECEYNMGNALNAAGRPGEAIAAYQAAVRLQPVFPAAEENLGSVYLSTGNPAAAADHYTVSLRQRPADADTHYDLGLALRALGRSTEAQAEFAAAARLGASPR
jgi:tetratricopeptide (TPR) repeat protein